MQKILVEKRRDVGHQQPLRHRGDPPLQHRAGLSTHTSRALPELQLPSVSETRIGVGTRVVGEGVGGFEEAGSDLQARETLV